MLLWVMNLGFAAGPSTAITLTENVIFSQAYNMLHPEEEDAMRPTSTSELIVRKRDKRPIIIGGDH